LVWLIRSMIQRMGDRMRAVRIFVRLYYAFMRPRVWNAR
jgi:hypothetical protein